MGGLNKTAFLDLDLNLDLHKHLTRIRLIFPELFRILREMTSPPEKPIQYVRGIGAKRADVLKEHGLVTVSDLMYYFPRAYLDRSTITPIGNLRKYLYADNDVTIVGTVGKIELVRGRGGRARLRVAVYDDTGVVDCLYFGRPQLFQKMFHEGEILALSGRPQFFGRTLQFTHPEFDRLSRSDSDEDIDWGRALHTGSIVPQYRSTEDLKAVKLDSRGFRRIIKNVIGEATENRREILSGDILQRCSLVPLGSALSSIHFPPTTGDLERARRRLKFDELFFLQMLCAYRKREVQLLREGIPFATRSARARKLVDSLPFELTKAQRKVVREIARDMESDKPMNRLLQGDVGSGKTIVALIAMLIAIDNGYQAAFMAPTEILAAQHYTTITHILGEMSLNIRLLLGGQKSKLREDVLEDIRSCHAQIIIGTHALIQQAVEFGRLGIIVIDEQHRFGVVQRAALREKGINPDVLVMTATPIPRTLSMTVYGDLDVSVIDELPKSRKPIRTIVKSMNQRQEVYAGVRSELAKGRQAYIVYPLIEESEKSDLEAAKKNYKRLKEEEFSGFTVGLMHGRMTTEEREDVMDQFRKGKVAVLVATTVIEVGIDVPNATIMVVENAERFGLAQLHQLRGRVGRGSEQSVCILIGKEAGTEDSKPKKELRTDDDEERSNARRRLQVMTETLDGFTIAEVDLQLRGPGEYFGTKQSGLPELRIANILTDQDILLLARSEAFHLVELDPQLRKPEHEAMKNYFVDRYKEQLSLVRVG